MKHRGALLAKGVVTGIQFETLLDDGLYQQIGAQAVTQAARVAQALQAAGCELMHPQETNQVFVALDEKRYAQLSARVEMSFWEQLADGRTVVPPGNELGPPPTRTLTRLLRCLTRADRPRGPLRARRNLKSGHNSLQESVIFLGWGPQGG